MAWCLVASEAPSIQHLDRATLDTLTPNSVLHYHRKTHETSDQSNTASLLSEMVEPWARQPNLASRRPLDGKANTAHQTATVYQVGMYELFIRNCLVGQDWRSPNTHRVGSFSNLKCFTHSKSALHHCGNTGNQTALKNKFSVVFETQQLLSKLTLLEHDNGDDTGNPVYHSIKTGY